MIAPIESNGDTDLPDKWGPIMGDSGCKGDGNSLVYEAGMVTSVSGWNAADESA